jgi:hypothetical protein
VPENRCCGIRPRAELRKRAASPRRGFWYQSSWRRRIGSTSGVAALRRRRLRRPRPHDGPRPHQPSTLKARRLRKFFNLRRRREKIFIFALFLKYFGQGERRARVAYTNRFLTRSLALFYLSGMWEDFLYSRRALLTKSRP